MWHCWDLALGSRAVGISRLTPKRDPASMSRFQRDAGWSSLVARWAHNPKVAGSNPAPATNFSILG